MLPATGSTALAGLWTVAGGSSGSAGASAPGPAAEGCFAPGHVFSPQRHGSRHLLWDYSTLSSAQHQFLEDESFPLD